MSHDFKFALSKETLETIGNGISGTYRVYREDGTHREEQAHVGVKEELWVIVDKYELGDPVEFVKFSYKIK